jgi:hypothetical protein
MAWPVRQVGEEGVRFLREGEEKGSRVPALERRTKRRRACVCVIFPIGVTESNGGLLDRTRPDSKLSLMIFFRVRLGKRRRANCMFILL